MKRMQCQCRLLAIALLCACVPCMCKAGDLVIQSFDCTGRLTFNTLNNATNYHVEWASSPAGPWTNFAAAMLTMDNIPATQTGSVTCSVPMCYRVVASVTNVNNYGFEEWVSGTTPKDWTIDDGIISVQEMATVHGGAYSIKLTRNTTDNSITDVAVASPGDFPVTVGKTYTITMWFWDNDTSASGRLVYSWYLADHTTPVGSPTYGSYTANSVVWQSLTQGATVPANAAFLRVGLRVYAENGVNYGGSIYLDDVSIVEN